MLFKKILFLIIFLFILILLWPQHKIFAIGMRTAPIVFQDVLRGQELNAQMMLINSDNKNVTYRFISSGQIAGWVSFFDKDAQNQIESISLAPQSRIAAVAKIKVPSNIPNGTYAGTVAILYTPENVQTAGRAVIQQRVDRNVSITVTDKENIQFDAAIMPLAYTIPQGEPLNIKISYDNQGNVDIAPDAQLKITRNDEVIYNAIFPYPDSNNPVHPFNQKTILAVQWPTAGQPEGIYQAAVNVLNNGQSIKQSTFDFQIGKANNSNSIDPDGILSFINKNSQLIWLILAIAIFGVAALIHFFRHRPRSV